MKGSPPHRLDCIIDLANGRHHDDRCVGEFLADVLKTVQPGRFGHHEIKERNKYVIGHPGHSRFPVSDQLDLESGRLKNVLDKIARVEIILRNKNDLRMRRSTHFHSGSTAIVKYKIRAVRETLYTGDDGVSYMMASAPTARPGRARWKSGESRRDIDLWGSAAVRKLDVGLEGCKALAEGTLVSNCVMWLVLDT